MLSQNAIRNIQAAVVLVGAIAAWIFVPGEILLPIAWVTIVVAVAGCFAIRAYMRRLHAQSRLSGEDQALYTEAGLGLGMLGIVAFFVLVLEYSG